MYDLLLKRLLGTVTYSTALYEFMKRGSSSVASRVVLGVQKHLSTWVEVSGLAQVAQTCGFS